MLKTKTKVITGFISILSVSSGIIASNIVANQVLADTCTDGQCNTTFQVNVVESLTVSLEPTMADPGNPNTFLRDTYNLGVSTNNISGFTASMYANNTDVGSTDDAKSSLLNTTDSSTTVQTLSDASSTRSAFPVNAWGFSLSNYTAADPTDTSSVPDTTSGTDSSTYKKLTSSTASPIPVLTSSTAASLTQDIYFGAKIGFDKPSGTYRGQVIISAVSGVVDSNTNPITPTNPIDVSDTTTYPSNTAVYTGSTGTNTYAGTASGTAGATAYSTTDGDSTTTTISSGDNRSAYQSAQGVTETTASSINSGAPLATGLAVTAGVAAASSLFFFILAKRKKDDEDEEEEEQA